MTAASNDVPYRWWIWVALVLALLPGIALRIRRRQPAKQTPAPRVPFERRSIDIRYGIIYFLGLLAFSICNGLAENVINASTGLQRSMLTPAGLTVDRTITVLSVVFLGIVLVRWLKVTSSSNPRSELPPAGRRGLKALSSLALGIFFCVPPASIGALILGIMALRSTKVQVGGRPAAWGGILLSIPGLILIGWFVYSTVWMSSQTTLFATQFIQDLDAGHMQMALNACDTGISIDDIQVWSAKVQGLGSPVHVECTLPLYQPAFRRTERRFAYTLGAIVNGTSSKSGTFNLGLIKSNGHFLVWEFE